MRRHRQIQGVRQCIGGSMPCRRSCYTLRASIPRSRHTEPKYDYNTCGDQQSKP